MSLNFLVNSKTQIAAPDDSQKKIFSCAQIQFAPEEEKI